MAALVLACGLGLYAPHAAALKGESGQGSGGGSQHDPAAHRLLSEAEQLLQAGDLDAAAERLREALDKDPQHPDAWVWLGGIQQQQGKLAEAQSAYQRALSLAPELGSAWFGLGNVLLAQGRAEDAARALRRATELQPTDAAVWYNLGIAQLRLGHFQQAVDPLRQAAAHKEDWVEALHALAVALLESGDAAAAAVPLQRAATLAPDNPDIKVTQYRIVAQDDPATAIKDLERLLEKHAEIVDGWQTLAQLYLASGEPRLRARAPAALRRAAHLAAGEPAIRMKLVDAYWDLNLYEEARKELASILDAHPDFARAWLVLGSYYVQEARYVEALAAFDRTLSLAPDRPVAHLRRGLALERLQRTEEARQAYAQAAKLDPDGVEAHLAVARTSLSLGDAAAAIAAVEQIPRSSWTAATFRYLGKARLLLGDFARSVEALRAAVTRDPEDRQAWVALAQALQRRGEPGAADALQRAQELSRNEPVVKQSRLAEGIAEHGKILLMQARVLINEGRAEEALATLDEALAYRPGDAAEITRLRSRARDLIDPEVGPFVDVASTLGLTAVNVSGRTEKRFILETTGSGAAWVDYDRDGRLDVMLANGNAARYMPLANGGSAIEPTGRSVDSLLRQGADGNFHDIARAAGVADPGWAGGVAVGDVDNDGWPDLYLTHYGANRLYRNNGDGTFTDITLAAHADDPRWSTSAAFADFDADGFLDLYIANYVVFDTAAPFLDGKQQCTFMGVPGFCGPSGMEGASDSLFWNDGALGFEPSSQGVVRDTAFYGLGVMPLHADDDGRIDLYVANDATPNLLFLNKGKRELEEDGLLYGVAYSGDGQEQAGMGIAAGDYDADGDDDIVVTNFSNDVDTLYRNIQPPPFRDATQAVGLALPTLAYLGWGTSLRDFDLDGDLDLFIANGHVYPQVDGRDIGTTYAQRNQIFANVVGRFVDIGKAAGTGMESVKSSRSTVIADYDGDGDEDILVTNIDDRPTLLRNDQARGNRWLQVHLVGRRSNRDGNDAQVTLISAAGSLTRTVETAAGYLGSSDPTLTFGLGDQLDGNLEVRWPSGAVERIERVPSGCLNLIVEGRGVVARRCS